MDLLNEKFYGARVKLWSMLLVALLALTGGNSEAQQPSPWEGTPEEVVGRMLQESNIRVTSPSIRAHTAVKARAANARGQRIELVDMVGVVQVPQLRVRFGR